MTAPTIRAVGAGNSYSGSNSTLAKPSGVVEGDLLIAILSADGPNSTISWASRIPAGWAIAEENLATGGTFVTHGAVAYKIAGASEPSTYAFSFGDQSGCGAIVAYQGVNQTTPINASAKQENVASATAHPIPSVTTTVADCLAIAIYQHRGNNGVPYTEPAGWTERIDYKGAVCNSNFGVADKVFASSGATGSVTATGNVADETWTVMLAIAPAGGGGGGNPTPTFTGPNIGNQTGTVGTALSSNTISDSFSDGDALTFSAIGSWPPGVTVSSAGIISGTPTTAGTYASLQVRATDTAAQTVDSDTFSFTISAAAVNGTITIPAVRDWGTGNLKVAQTGVQVDVLSVTSGNLVVRKTGQTTHATTADLVVTDAAIVAGTLYGVIDRYPDGSKGYWEYTAT